jgi:DNA polymerase V
MPVIALVDCNNFFVSCERVFNPKLKNRPVVVLSNNDGCAISRSNEAKKLGIKMGAPYFQFKDLASQHGVIVLSSNFGLYSEMSRRVMETISQFSPQVEYYSVDEAFFILPTNISDPDEYGHLIRNTILRWTGIPVSVGLAQTKTLAKLANEYTKTHNPEVGVLDFSSLTLPDLDQRLSLIPVTEIWGIGRQQGLTLHMYQVKSVLDFKHLDPKFVQQKFTITGLRTHQELHNISCLQVNTKSNPQKSMIVSRSFGQPIYAQKDLLQALASHTAKAAEKLRQKELKTTSLTIYITNKKTFSRSKTIQLPEPTNFTSDLIKHIPEALNHIFEPSIIYKKAGIVCSKLISAAQTQLNLLDLDSHGPKKEMHFALDAINRKYGHNTLQFLSQGISKKWLMKQEKKSPNYLSSWTDLAKISA